MSEMNILVIAGYDVLAHKILEHREYVKNCFWQGEKEKTDLIFTVGGATNPDYPEFTEAEANYKILKEEFNFLDNSNSKIISTYPRIRILPIGNTSAETLQAVKKYIERKKISVCKLILCAEQSRLTGFLLDALFMGLIDLSKELVAYGFSFQESKNNFGSQRKKLFFKLLSHYGRTFRFARKIWQKLHQKKMARRKRKERE